MALQARSLSPQESRVVLALSERGLKGVAREDIIKLLGANSKAVDNIMESLRRKGWLERASWGKYLLIPAEQGREGPSAIAIFWRRPVSSPNLIRIILATAPPPLIMADNPAPQHDLSGNAGAHTRAPRGGRKGPDRQSLRS
jgi:hypothetical protein